MKHLSTFREQYSLVIGDAPIPLSLSLYLYAIILEVTFRNAVTLEKL